MTTDSSRRPDGGPSLERGPRDREAGPHLLVAERQVLEMIARGDPLPRVLDGLCRLAEGISPGLMALIRLLDREGRHLTNGAAPSLPPAFAALLDGRPSRPIFGPCTRALAERLPVLVADVDTDPRWEAYRSLTAPHGIRSCWSFPIVALDGRPLGTLALFSREPRDPTPEQRSAVEQVVRLASIAVERGQAEIALRRSEAYQAEAQRLSHTGSFSWHVPSGEITWSDETFRIYDLDRDEPPSFARARERVHPDDLALFERTAERATREGRDFAFGHRLLMPDGSVKYLHITATAVRDDAGALVEYIGAVRDVTERKRAERALRRARVRELEARYAAMMEERSRIAREIHDTLLQGFNGVALMLLAAAGKVDGPPEAVRALQHVLDLAEKTLGDARRAVWDLRAPTAVGDLATAIREAAVDGLRGTGLRLQFASDGAPRPLDSRREAVVFRVVQEAVANAVKHASARRLRVRLTFGTQGVRLLVRDDGCGFVVDPDFRAYGGHWGLLGMWERAIEVGARLRVRSAPGRGTAVVLRLPYASRGVPRSR